MQLATELYTDAADKALARELQGTASGYAAHLAWTEALYGDPATSARRVREIVSRVAGPAEGPGSVPRFRLGAALGLAGLMSQARAIVAPAERRYPASTLVRTVLSPTVEAAIALQRRQPDDAIAALEGARASETGTVAGLVPVYLRGEAYLAKRDTAAARREYQRILDRRGADPFEPVVALAHLGIARAWAVEGDDAKSRAAYEQLFEVWSNADADLPILQRARAEYARLAPGRPPSR
jgi:tetratricopeptide (TPR) repeat protein